jgi:hypothetical protein
MIKTKQPNLGEIAEQTQKSWAKKIASYSDVPAAYQSFFRSFQQSEVPFPYTIQCPTFEGFQHESQDMLVCMLEQRLYIVGKNQSMDEALCFTFSNIGHMQYSSFLLDSTLQISGISHQDEWRSAEMRFNTISDYLFLKIMETIRQEKFSPHPKAASLPAVDAETENLKFSNQIRHTLLEGEKLVFLIWQAELSKPLLGFPLPFLEGTFYYRLIFPNQIVMLTDQEFIQIQESGSPNRVNSYGSIWDFAPLQEIEQAEITSDGDEYLMFKIQLKNGDEIESKFVSSKKSELKNMKQMIEALV